MTKHCASFVCSHGLMTALNDSGVKSGPT